MDRIPHQISLYETLGYFGKPRLLDAYEVFASRYEARICVVQFISSNICETNCGGEMLRILQKYTQLFENIPSP